MPLAILLAGAGCSVAETDSALDQYAVVWVSANGRDWTQVPDDSAFDHGEMLTVTAGGPGLVAAGVVAVSEVDSDAAVWVSVDGYGWTSVEDAEAFQEPRYQEIRSVAIGGPGLVAVGVSYSATSGIQSRGAIWVSADGYDWTRVAVGGRPEELNAVTSWEGRLVAVGTDWSGHEPAAVVWLSEDGYHWTRVVDPEGKLADASMSSITVGGPGLVAVGHLDTPEWDAAVWLSADGTDWMRIDDESMFGGPDFQNLSSVTAGGPGLVAVGEDASQPNAKAAVWVSADGYGWSRADDPAAFTSPGVETILSVTAGDPGLVAVGGDTVWVSADGYDWTRLDLPGALEGSQFQSLFAVTSGGPGFVAVGRSL